MGVRGHPQTGRRCAIRASGFLRLFPSGGETLGLFAAILILINAVVPYWHSAQKMQAWAAASAHAATYGAVECSLHANGPEGQKDSGKAPNGEKPCPLCQALQLFSPGVAPLAFTFVPCASVEAAVPVPPLAELKSGRLTREDGRPRAPPLA